ncbi:hypothetical protein ABAC460_21400 [Asticcacaulis sp. AC460]|nr:hypothetical protein ABAC460_21400 [Asticcacaulis sp. AC460]
MGDKPTTGMSAAARFARHAALAATARHLGIKVICLAHTADDIAEAAYMRTQGSNVGTPRTWSPSPVWPQGRGVFLCRPLLDVRRADLRDCLTQAGVTWIDDPANDNPQSLRARARQVLQGRAGDDVHDDIRLARAEIEALLHDPEGWSGLGLLRFKAEPFYRMPKDVALHLLATAAVCAGGGDRLPRGDRIERLYDQVPGGASHTLAGARIQQAHGLIHIHREAGDIGRHGDPQQGDMWDGRFELARQAIATGRDRSGLNAAGQAFLKWLPADLRGTLPAVTGSGPHLALPLYGVPGQKHNETVTATCWVLARFLASACRIERETDL